jgi:cellulose synthase/poly-beta-1,6-N-acetylglucosamine synthase-like glycosyltransferase
VSEREAGAAKRWSVAVVVPAHEEALTIGSCVASIRAAAGACSRVRECWIVVVADSCSDGTGAVAARALAGGGAVIHCDLRSAGAARRIGACAALDHYDHVAPASLWIANTDADTVVPRDWLECQLGFAEHGIAGVAGIVRIESVPGYESIVARQLMSDYRIGANGTHGHVHGANLGVRADAYADAGGWSNRALAEDHCLWRRLTHRGWRLRSSTRSVVLTSGRLQGRAAGGFADTLNRKWQAGYGRPHAR